MRLISFGSAVLLTLIGFAVAWQFVNPAPPHTLVIATGQTDGAYYLFAQRYQQRLAQDGIELEIRATAGSIENLELLGNNEVDLAFVQGGTGAATAADTLTSLGSLYYEPLWVFYRGEQTLSRLGQLHNMSLAIGKPGSGTYAIARQLLADNFIDAGTNTIQALGGAAGGGRPHQPGASGRGRRPAPRRPPVQDVG